MPLTRTPLAMLLLLLSAQGDILLAEWRNTAFRPCHFLAVDRARG